MDALRGLKIIIMNKKGFTLIELLVVISIISLLSSVVLTSVEKARIKARNTQRIANANAIATGFYIATTGNTNQFPITTHNYVCLGKTPCWYDEYGMSSSAEVDTLLKKGMAGGIIPLDPLWRTPESGDAFFYVKWNSSSPAAIHWRMEYEPGNTNEHCGKGYSLGYWFVPYDGSWTCQLDLD